MKKVARAQGTFLVNFRKRTGGDTVGKGTPAMAVHGQAYRSSIQSKKNGRERSRSKKIRRTIKTSR